MSVSLATSDTVPIFTLARVVNSLSINLATTSTLTHIGSPTLDVVANIRHSDTDLVYSDSRPPTDAPSADRSCFDFSTTSCRNRQDRLENSDKLSNPLTDLPPTRSAPRSSTASSTPTSTPQIPIDHITNITSLQPWTEYELQCFIGPATVSPVPPEPHDCLSALGLLLHGDKIDAPILFSEDFGFHVPHRWVWNTCVIIIQNDPKAVVTSTLQSISDATRIIIEHCLDKMSDYCGGLLRIGEMYISVNGRIPGKMGKWKTDMGSQAYYDGVWEDLRL